jgi:hypothetical protein
MHTPRRPKKKKCKRCNTTITVAAKGPIPTYCGQSCKQQAYESRRHRGPMRLLAEDIATASVRGLIRSEIWNVLAEMGLVKRTPPALAKQTATKTPLRLVKNDEPGLDQQSQPPDPEGRN